MMAYKEHTAKLTLYKQYKI